MLSNDTSEISKRKEELTNRMRVIDTKINSNNELKSELTLIKSKFLKQVNDHIKSEYTRISMVKIAEIKNELEACMVSFEKDLSEANERGNMLKNRLNEEINHYSEIINPNKNSPQKQSQQQRNQTSFNRDDDLLDYDDDALMINESINEFSDLNDSKTVDLQRILNNIELLEQQIQNFLSETYLFNLNKLEYKECRLNVEDICLGHLNSKEMNLINHESFQLDTPLADNLTFEKDRECKITISCPVVNESVDESEKIKSCLKIDLIDSALNSIPFILKERLISANLRIFQIYFKPNLVGIYKLSIRYKSTKIVKSPFYFVVLPSKTSTNTPPVSSSVTMNEQLDLNDANSKLKNLHINLDETVNSSKSNETKPRGKLASMMSDSSSDTFEKTFSSTISIGRGRLLKNKDQAKESNHSNSPFNIISQKRKSPSVTADLNNNVVSDMPVDEDYVLPKESMSKLQRANAMDTDQLHAYFNTSVTSPIEKKPNCILSNHIRKYSGEETPSIKAQFVKQFDQELNFPIGVIACVQRDYLIVCNSSNHDVKIFHRVEANLIHTISSGEKFAFERPSALRINNNELFVKDDKEILVFDLDDNFKFLRRFGEKILKKPYGLTFNSDDDLVVVDANTKEPKIHSFNKATGELIKSFPFEPSMPQYAKSSTLNFLHYNNRADLPLIEKSKIRFIDSTREHLYAADLGRSIIFKTNFSGRIVKAFGTFGKRNGQFFEPSGIHVDYDGKALLIGDSKNNRIQLYDDEGKYKCTIEFMDEKINRPSDIYVDMEGYLYVSCFLNGRIKKFKLHSS